MELFFSGRLVGSVDYVVWAKGLLKNIGYVRIAGMNFIGSKALWIKLMKIGSMFGCHQMAVRSLFYRQYQFPVCARCTGVLIGNISALALFLIYTLPFQIYIMGCALMFIDWLIQYLDIRESTNIRRLITGVIGGYSLTTLYCMTIKYAIRLLLNKVNLSGGV